MNTAEKMAYAMFPWAWDGNGSVGEKKRDQQQALSKALLALEAMRQPSDAMMTAGVATRDKPRGMSAIWIAMIDAAILEAKQ